MYKTKFDDQDHPDVVKQDWSWTPRSFHRVSGRRNGEIVCPFCKTAFRAWMIRGAGKRCPKLECSAIFSAYGVAIRMPYKP